MTELAVEDYHRLLAGVAAGRGSGLLDLLPKEEVFDSSCRVDVNSTGDVTTVVLIVKATVDDMESVDLSVEITVKKLVHLEDAYVSGC